jgi:hypothetical protein
VRITRAAGAVAGCIGVPATMNVWLIKQVMQKLADNGGKVPAELQH